MVWAQFIWFIVSLIVSVALAPKPPTPKPATIDDFDLPTARLDRPLPVLFGTKRITGPNVLWYGDLLSTKIKQKSLFSSTTIGFRYYLGIHFGIGYGPVDQLTKIEVGDREIFSGNITSNTTFEVDELDLFGGEKKEGGMRGPLSVMMGLPSQTANTYMDGVIAGPMPAFRHMFGIVWERGFIPSPAGNIPTGYLGNTPFLKPWAFTCKRIKKGWVNDLVWNETKAEVGNGMNPIHIIYQVLTDHRFGQGTSTAQIDDPSFMEAADTCFTEGLGLNLLWNQSSRVEDFLQIVMDHIGGVLALDPANNKYVIKLFRDDYDKGTLDEFGPDEISEQGMTSLQTQAWGETVNELVITYTDPDTLKGIPLVVQDLANIRNQQGVISEKIDRSGITDTNLINVVASRELASRSSPLWRARFIINREFWDKAIGDVFKLSWPTPLLSSVVMRVMKAAPGTLEDGKIAVEALQDIYALVGLNYNVVQGAGVQTPVLPTPVADDTNPNILSSTINVPPGGATDGDRYLIPATPPATGDWASHEGEIAEWNGDELQWDFITVFVGIILFDEDTGTHITTDGAGGSLPFEPAGSGSSIDSTGTPAAAARVVRSTNQLIAPGPVDVIVFDGQVIDTEDFWPNGSDFSTFYANFSGQYAVTANVAWDASTDGFRTLILLKNGAEIIASTKQAAVAGLEQTLSSLIKLSEGDTISTGVQSDAAASVNLVASSGIPNMTISRQRTLLAPSLMRGATWTRADSVIIPPVNDVHQYFSKPAYIHGITMLGGPSIGSCVVDIWKDTLANYPPTVADTIVGSVAPEIIGDTTYFDNQLIGWNKELLAGDVLTFHLETSSAFEQIFVQLEIRETE